MTRDPVSDRLTDWQMLMLSKIFRIILKEITCEEDITLLAPGELGIDYHTGSLYVRNPHNGKIFSPNNINFIKSILNKFDPKLNILNADKVSGITFYSRLGELDKLDIEYTPDTVIRQMHGPAVLFAGIEYENYKVLGWPSNRGMCLVYKTDEERVLIRYYDSRTYITYEGRYNQFKHMFEGWAIAGGCMDSTFDETHGGGDTTSVYINKELRDLMVITVRVTETLNPGATISVDHHDPVPIVMQNGKPLAHEIAADNIIMLIYNELENDWILVESTESVVLVTLSIINSRIDVLRADLSNFKNETTIKFQTLEDAVREEFVKVNDRITEVENTLSERIDEVIEQHNSDISDLTDNIADTAKALTKYVDQQVTDLREDVEDEIGRLDDRINSTLVRVTSAVYNYTAPADNIGMIEEIPDYDPFADHIMVNYGQTLLRIGLDYIIEGTGIRFTNNVTINTGEVVQIIVIKQEKSK